MLSSSDPARNILFIVSCAMNFAHILHICIYSFIYSFIYLSIYLFVYLLIDTDIQTQRLTDVRYVDRHRYIDCITCNVYTCTCACTVTFAFTLYQVVYTRLNDIT